jgi:hypothetical protein
MHINRRIFLLLYLVMITTVFLTTHGEFATNHSYASDSRNSDDKDQIFCSKLSHYFSEIRDVINIENTSEEKLDAISALRVFLVVEFNCADEFEDFEWD